MIEQLDHLVLTVSDVTRSCEFYSRVLGMQVVSLQGNRKALRFGTQKINLHPQSTPFAPHATHPQPGSADLCFLCKPPLAAIMQSLRQHRVDIIEGPVQRTGATGPIESVYIRDPDENLLELAVQLHSADTSQ